MQSINQLAFAIETLMNNYTHAYSQYVHHILNKSPSKPTYSFSKSERFPGKRGQHLRTEIATLQFQDELVQKSPQRKRISPLRLSQTAVGTNHRELDNYQRRYLHLNADEVWKKTQNKSKSKSPIKTQPATSNHLKQREDYQKDRTYYNQKNNQSYLNQSNRGGKKHQSRSPTKKFSPTKTHTQILHEIDHVSKNQTHRGYYPTGVELSVNGRYPISTIRNVPVHSFGRSEQRYGYKLQTSDPLGPGYYNNFSEFGQPYKK